MTSSHSQAAPAPIAVVGVGAVYPGCAQTEDLWRNILAGADLLSDVPAHYWLTEDYFDADPAAPLKTYGRRGGFLPRLPFDTVANGLPPSTAPMTDSMQLLALIVAKRVLEDACGLDLGRLDRARTSVILGVGGGTSLLGTMNASLQRPVWTKVLRERGLPESQVQAICAAIEAQYTPWTENTFPGLLTNVAAGRVASRFDLGGTNCVIDAACASSLAAIRMAVQELRLGAADMVLAGGCDAGNDPMMFMCFSKTPALSRKGDCRPFSEDADGTMLGEGVGMFALRRLEDAERDGDQVYAVLRGLGSSSDGRAKSIYAPRAEGQMHALRRAFEGLDYTPLDVDLVEAHGTGTAAGDAAEVSALKAVYAEAGGEARNWCALGSVKSQIGHTKAAAGAASLYKVVMALHHKVLPPTAKVSRPNPALGLGDSPFHLSTAPRPWIKPSGQPRRAAVSSFGFGGSNYHMTVEEYLGAVRPRRIRALPTELVLAGGRDPSGALAQARQALAEGRAPGAFAVAARASQAAFEPTAPVRLAFVAADSADLESQIEQVAARLERETQVRLPKSFASAAPAKPGRVGFLFPGQGSQYVGMGADLAMAFDAARAVWDEAAADADGRALHRAVFTPTAFDDEEARRQAQTLTATEVAQPAIGVTSQMMLAVLAALGLEAEAAAGHSFGELTALHYAGALDAEGFRRAARARGDAMAAAARETEGGMIAVFAPAEAVSAVIAEGGLAGLTIANLNAPDQTVLAGPRAEIEAVRGRLDAAGMAYRPLGVATAFHSPIVAPAAAPFRAVLENLKVGATRIPVFACATAKPYPAKPKALRDQLASQLAEPVRFVEQVEAMYAAGIDTFIEVGPASALTELAGRILAGRPHTALALDRRGRAGTTQLWEVLAALSVAGHRIEFASLWAGYPETAPKPVEVNAATLLIDGATFGKPYPPAGGAAALPAPNPEPPPAAAPPARAAEPVAALAAVPEPTPAAPVVSASPAASDPAAAARAAALLEALRHSSEAHVAVQKAMADAHAAYLRQTQEVMSALAGAGPAAPDAETAPMRHATPPQELAPAQSPVPPAPPAAQPAGYAPPSAAAPPTAPGGDRADLLLRIISDKTGYPVEMLSPDMELEADLGVDSIKRVEILAALRAAAPDLPDLDPQALAGLASISAILAKLDAVGEEPSATPAKTAPAAAAAPSAVAHSSSLGGLLLSIIAEKTGYPVEMLDPGMELEADLGVDSIKRVEILAALKSAAPQLPEVDPQSLAGLGTISAILARLGEAAAPAAPGPAASVLPVATVAALPPSELSGLLLSIIAEKTGYPVEMLDPGMELEADLGIDSIKRVEILAALRSAAPQLPEVDPQSLAGLGTISAILARLGEAAAPAAPGPAAPALPVATPAAPPPTDLSALLLSIIAEKTGYPAEMLDPAMELEADLGIDSIKRVEILAALRSAAPQLPEVDPQSLAGLGTISAILARLGEAAAPAAPGPAASASPVATAAAPPPSDLSGLLLSIIAEKTGYPVEMLDPGMELEADLGIDSIKRVEILAALKSAAPQLPEVDPQSLAGLGAISAILAKLGETATARSDQAGAAGAPVVRRVGLVEAPIGDAAGSPLLGPGATVAIAGEGAGLAEPLARLLREAGHAVIDPDEADQADALILLHGLEHTGGAAESTRRHLRAFAAARRFAGRAAKSDAVLVSVQDSAGEPWMGGLAGLAKCAAAEWPRARVRAIDLERGRRDAEALAARLVAELRAPAAAVEVALRADGRRTTPVEVALGPTQAHGPDLPEDAVLVASGGGRGIVAECLVALCQKRRLRLVLLGRTILEPEPQELAGLATHAALTRAIYGLAEQSGTATTPREVAAQAGRILAAREIRATLARLQAAGSDARYHSVDATDPEALQALLSKVRTEWGAIDGVLHGAGVLADKLIAEQKDEAFARVFATKAEGLRALLDATADDPLSRLCLFSSVAARYGNVGQAAYAAGNEVLNKVARAEARRRGDACRVMSLNWGAWDGGMVDAGLREAFARRGVQLIGVADGAAAFVDEMLGRASATDPAPVEVVLGAPLTANAGAAQADLAPAS